MSHHIYVNTINRIYFAMNLILNMNHTHFYPSAHSSFQQTHVEEKWQNTFHITCVMND